MTEIEKLKAEIWRKARPSRQFPQDWLVIPALDMIELIKDLEEKE
jgi:hypothetical protein